MSQDTSVIFSGNEENASVEMNCSGEDPLISIAVALWVAVMAFVFFIYLYWRHIHLKPSFHVSFQNHSEMQETSLHSGKTTDLTVEKELEQRETEQYEFLKGRTNQKDVYHTLDTKQQEPSLENEESIHAKDF